MLHEGVEDPLEELEVTQLGNRVKEEAEGVSRWRLREEGQVAHVVKEVECNQDLATLQKPSQKGVGKGLVEREGALKKDAVQSLPGQPGFLLLWVQVPSSPADSVVEIKEGHYITLSPQAPDDVAKEPSGNGLSSQLELAVHGVDERTSALWMRQHESKEGDKGLGARLEVFPLHFVEHVGCRFHPVVGSTVL